jgi:hypothetical protein
MKLTEAINEVMRTDKQKVFNMIFTTNEYLFIVIMENIGSGNNEEEYFAEYGVSSWEEIIHEYYDDAEEMVEILPYLKIVFSLFTSNDVLIMDSESVSFNNLDISKWKYCTSVIPNDDVYIVFTNEPYFPQ